MHRDWHDQIKHEIRMDRKEPVHQLRVPDGGSVSVTLESSGEIRVATKIRKRNERAAKGSRGLPLSTGRMPGLVHSSKVRDRNVKKAGYGKLARVTKFTSAARRLVKNGCGVLKREFGKSITFATVTLVGSTASAMRALAEQSGRAADLFMHWVKSKAPGANIVYVWELQGRGALHLHAAIGHHDHLCLRTIEHGIKEYVYQWHETLSRHAGVDMFQSAEGFSWRGFPEVVRSNSKPIRKCVKAYMSKYLTKGGAGESGNVPARWWGMSDAVRDAVARYRKSSRRSSRSASAIRRRRQLVLEAAARQECISYTWNEPFSLGSCTTVLYPEEADVEPLYEMLCRVLAEGSDDTSADVVLEPFGTKAYLQDIAIYY